MLNSAINDQLSSIAGIIEGDVVLEIGPGTGSLTNVLINAGATVFAVEKVSVFPFFVVTLPFISTGFFVLTARRTMGAMNLLLK
ncbi:hypothetical protein KSP40_PGU008191 [Platanthera guangdongensis]|uniref:rRNA adenine N(6)-methyltransferase n=1 Tax=Platanthera guangdongensis TaxID=2320717 RepID=A0ABR2MPJ6_9ASPA